MLKTAKLTEKYIERELLFTFLSVCRKPEGRHAHKYKAVPANTYITYIAINLALLIA
jgi:prenyltransferase beta subunit